LLARFGLTGSIFSRQFFGFSLALGNSLFFYLL
jgi:hypothetical protein